MKARRSLALAPLLAAALSLAGMPARLLADDEPTLAPSTQQTIDLQTKADDLLKQKKLDEAAATYERLLDHLDVNKDKFAAEFPESQQKGVRVHALYNLACARALGGKGDKALDSLEKAIAAGFFDWQLADKDEDLASVRESPRFTELLEKLKGSPSRDLAKLVKDTLQEDPLFPYDFEVTTLEGKPLKLSDLKGKTVVLDVFGTWCPPCRDEVPHFVQLANKAKERGEAIVVVGLSYERVEPTDEVAKTVKAFVTEQKIPYAVSLVAGNSPALERIPKLEAFPTTLWIDAKGKVRGRVEGALSFEEIDAITHRLASENADAKPEKKPSGEPEKHADEPF